MPKYKKPKNKIAIIFKGTKISTQKFPNHNNEKKKGKNSPYIYIKLTVTYAFILKKIYIKWIELDSLFLKMTR